MENYLMLDGKKYELSPELVNALRPAVAEPEKKNPFERCKGSKYYHIDNRGNVVDVFAELHDNMDDALFAVANYCTDKSLMEQRAMHETLNRLLWRYSEEHGGDKLTWAYDGRWTPNYHYFIAMEFVSGKGIVSTKSNDSNKAHGVVYFRDKATAESAIEEIVKPFIESHPDFVW